MARLEPKDFTYFSTVRGMCRNCRKIVPARVYFKDGKVYQQSLCPDCESTPALIAGSQEWYLKNVLTPLHDYSPLPHSHEPKRGCPHDCGPCAWHAAPCQLPVFSITNDCNLSCSHCFTYNRPDKKYYMSIDELDATVDWVLKAAGSVDLVNITGGEPTLHPDLVEILNHCCREGIGRVTMNSNGIKLAEDFDLCRRLADMGIYIILSCNTFDPEVSEFFHGRDLSEIKLRAIENLTRAGAKMTLLNVMLRGVNEEVTGELLDMMMSNDQILNMTIQTMTYTGQGGGSWEKREHIPVDEAAEILCRNSKGRLEVSDFTSRPSAHPLCYQSSYMVKSGDSLLPFTRFAEPETIKSFMTNSYLLRLDSKPDFFREIIDRLYSENREVEIRIFRNLLKTLYPGNKSINTFERQRLAESAIRSIYIHGHMDEDNFDCSRAAACPDQVPSEPGKLISACTYNLFYRMKDPRFYVDR